MSYSWMIDFTDLDDESVRKQGNTYLATHPDSSKNYYDITAQRAISFAQTFGIDVTVLNVLNRTDKPPHDSFIQWMVLCLQMLVCQNLVGMNNDPIIDDKWRWKYDKYNANFKSLSKTFTMEMFYTATMQQNYTRSGGAFTIMTT
jgi:hypothetical protein